jgi:hypothetical protein
MTVAQPSAAARRHCSSNTASSRVRSAPSAHIQPNSTPTQATGSPLARTRSSTESAGLPDSSARRKSSRRSSIPFQPVAFAIASASAKGVASRVQV